MAKNLAKSMVLLSTGRPTCTCTGTDGGRPTSTGTDATMPAVTGTDATRPTVAGTDATRSAVINTDATRPATSREVLILISGRARIVSNDQLYTKTFPKSTK